jgi:hypothetical protein
VSLLVAINVVTVQRRLEAQAAHRLAEQDHSTRVALDRECRRYIPSSRSYAVAQSLLPRAREGPSPARGEAAPNDRSGVNAAQGRRLDGTIRKVGSEPRHGYLDGPARTAEHEEGRIMETSLPRHSMALTKPRRRCARSAPRDGEQGRRAIRRSSARTRTEGHHPRRGGQRD